MYTIASNVTNTIEIKKSKFMSFLIKVDNIGDIKNTLDKYRDKYSDATHVCYAYILDGLEKASDDNEPSGTAGKPILDILKKNNLDHILAIVVRYFGGIKLGAGGLIRAYAKSINDLVKKSELKELTIGYIVKFSISYDKVSYIDNMNINIKYKEFDISIIYEAIVKEEDIDTIKLLTNSFEIIDKIKTSF